ncbi:uncharacterized protein E0L32_011634 [Thyridium curvatum]|uniref:RRM domain-containing protein n=1 Tax=Thyridium curvatum TaxID=1093900 RepID=A0A507BLT3_9PEZI|nr:uncharacterized protein E0L32_011634 [Thyridium curvatum]TPX18449.1 hypothetical protein E0L32_011634 [Thyridium curvatum]
MSTKPPSKVVFVGNIPYGLSEEQISDIFSGAGRVLNFRLVYDRETGRPKGFGFAEYPDADSAASAVRNLNDHEIMGRKLRVDFSNEGGSGGDDGAAGYTGSGHANMSDQNGYAPPPAAAALPPLPQGKDLPPGASATDEISRILRTLPPMQLLDILSQMKALSTTDPARATELLNQAPQLAYAVFQALLLMELVSPEAIHSVLDSSAAPPPPQAAPAVYGYPPAATGTPPVGGAYAPAPVAAAPPAQPAQDPDALIKQVLELPQAVVDQLPEAERAQVMALRTTYAAQYPQYAQRR